MEVNVAQLLKAPIGTTRQYDVDEEVEFCEDGSQHHVKGQIKLVRTHRGILLEGKLDIEADLTCSRCLSLFRCPLSLNIEEEYVPSIDVITGVPLTAPEDETVFLIDEHHILDLTEAIRQYTLLAAPMKPLCKEDCAGLCRTCGYNLDLGECKCSGGEIDPRWSQLLNNIRTEIS